MVECALCTLPLPLLEVKLFLDGLVDLIRVIRLVVPTFIAYNRLSSGFLLTLSSKSRACNDLVLMNRKHYYTMRLIYYTESRVIKNNW